MKQYLNNPLMLFDSKIEMFRFKEYLESVGYHKAGDTIWRNPNTKIVLIFKKRMLCLFYLPEKYQGEDIMLVGYKAFWTRILNLNKSSGDEQRLKMLKEPCDFWLSRVPKKLPKISVNPAFQ